MLAKLDHRRMNMKRKRMRGRRGEERSYEDKSWMEEMKSRPKKRHTTTYNHVTRVVEEKEDPNRQTLER